MDEAQIKELLQTILTPMFQQTQEALKSYVNQSVASMQSDFETRLEQQSTPQPEPTTSVASTEPVEMLALKSQLKEMQASLDAQRKSESNARFESYLSSYAAEKQLTAPNLFLDVVQRRLGDKLVESNRQWFVKDGEETTSLQSKLDEFLSSNEGKALMPASGTSGTGSSQSNPHQQPAPKSDPWQELAAAYADGV